MLLINYVHTDGNLHFFAFLLKQKFKTEKNINTNYLFKPEEAKEK